MQSQIAQLKEAISQSDALMIGAGAGLSASAGFSYSGARFREHFADFEKKYGFHDMYTGGFYDYDTPQEHWAYWSRYIYCNRYDLPPNKVYGRLLDLARDKDYFVLTTNVDHQFQLAGFDKSRLFYTQGDYGLFQCSVPCRMKTYDNEQIIRRMVKEQEDMRIPDELLPLCPVCGAPMMMNLRSDERFVEDEGWHAAARRYDSYMKEHRHARIVYLELGVGYNTPGIIKYSFRQMTARNPKALYACLNKGQADCPDAIRDRALCIDGDIAAVLEQL